MAFGIYQHYAHTIIAWHTLWKGKLISMDLSILGYEIKNIPHKAGRGVFIEGELVARFLGIHEFYQFLLEEKVDWLPIISKRLLSDSIILVIAREVLFVIDVKYQKVAGHVDEDLLTCDFTRKQYLKLVGLLGLKVEYIYVLNDWFRKKEYKDVLDYICSVNCHYIFNEFPFSWLGLSIKKG
jgi:hypothetical protein